MQIRRLTFPLPHTYEDDDDDRKKKAPATATTGTCRWLALDLAREKQGIKLLALLVWFTFRKKIVTGWPLEAQMTILFEIVL